MANNLIERIREIKKELNCGLVEAKNLAVKEMLIAEIDKCTTLDGLKDIVQRYIVLN